MLSAASDRVSRRSLLAAAAASATAAAVRVASTEAQAQALNKTTYVLVHSAWHGGWCWKKVTPLLRAAGNDVYAPTLTGLGERSHLAHPQIGLETHVQDVVNVLKYEGLNRVILVGHSSSGAVITGVADRVPELLARVVYLDAFVPDHGQSLMDLIPADRRQGMEQRVQTEGRGWLLPSLAPGPWDPFLRQAWQIADEDARQWMLARLAATPFKIFSDPVHRTNPAADRLPRTFVRCLHWPNPTFDRHAATARQAPGWRYRELPTSHEPFVTHPQDLATVLLEAAA
jgi:pimeloyl-ACP methyl ester carboxylesterase